MHARCFLVVLQAVRIYISNGVNDGEQVAIVLFNRTATLAVGLTTITDTTRTQKITRTYSLTAGAVRTR